MNKAICKKTDEHFTKGKIYTCSAAYVRYEAAVVDVKDDHENSITVQVNDEDFEFRFNCE